MVYELVGVVSHVSDPRFPDKNNLVACIKVGPSYHVRAKVSSVSHWYLLNDIRYVSENNTKNSNHTLFVIYKYLILICEC